MEEERRQNFRREADRCPDCVVNEVGEIKEHMQELSKMTNRIFGAQGVIILLIGIFVTILSISITRISDLKAKQVEIDTNQKHVLNEIGKLAKINSGMASYVEKIEKHNDKQIELATEQNKMLKKLTE